MLCVVSVQLSCRIVPMNATAQPGLHSLEPGGCRADSVYMCTYKCA